MGVDVAGEASVVSGTGSLRWSPGVAGKTRPCILRPPASGSQLTVLSTGLLRETRLVLPAGWMDSLLLLVEDGSFLTSRGGMGGG